MTALLSRFRSFTARFGRFSPRPERDWRVLLSTCAILLVLLVAWHLVAFRLAIRAGALGGASQVSTAAAAPSALDTLPGFLDARAAEDQKYEVGSYSFSDPSQ